MLQENKNKKNKSHLSAGDNCQYSAAPAQVAAPAPAPAPPIGKDQNIENELQLESQHNAKNKPQLAAALASPSVNNNNNQNQNQHQHPSYQLDSNSKKSKSIVQLNCELINVCAGCSRPIREQFLLEALDKRWHEDCLKCACCECRLGEVGSSLFIHLDKIFCRRDYLRIFGQRGQCAVCRNSIEPYEFVMRAKGHAYHIECFACQQCQARFCVGDQFCLWEPSKIVCFHCHQSAASNSEPGEPAAAAAANESGAPTQISGIKSLSPVAAPAAAAT